MWFGKKAESLPLVNPEIRKGFQVGDKVVVVRFPNEGTDDVADFEHVYGRIGTIAAVIRDHAESVYDYTVKFEGWMDGWDETDHTAGPHWGVYHRNLRRVVSKHSPV